MRTTLHRVPEIPKAILVSDIPDWSEHIALNRTNSFGLALGDTFKLEREFLLHATCCAALFRSGGVTHS